MSHVCPNWLLGGIPRDKCDISIKKAKKALRWKKFDTIACCGVSGLLLGPILAHLMNKELIVVRKWGASTHSDSFHKIEGFKGVKNYMIVDDICCTGDTIRDILKRVKKFAPKGKCVGLYLYGQSYGKFRPGLTTLETVEFAELVALNT